MTKNAVRIRESGVLERKSAKGTYPVTIITEGQGSSAYYSGDLLESQHSAFDNAVSFMDHPENPERPWERSVTRIGGRIVGETWTEKTEDGLVAVRGNWKPRKEYAEFVEEYFDVLGLSIYIGAKGEANDDEGTFHVTEFDATDPYKSVDVVVAAGRGGKFNAAMESARQIESSLGTPRADKPAVEASAEEEEGNMELKEVVEAQSAKIDALAAAVSELKDTLAAKATAEAEAEAVTAAVAEAMSAYTEKVEAINAAEDLLPSQRTALLESARNGEDIATALESARVIASEAKAAFGAQNEEPADGFVYESGRASEGADDMAFLLEAAGYGKE